jgi:hypothetical protein
VEFIEAPTFAAHLAEYLEDDDYRALQAFWQEIQKPATSCRGLVASGS